MARYTFDFTGALNAQLRDKDLKLSANASEVVRFKNLDAGGRTVGSVVSAILRSFPGRLNIRIDQANEVIDVENADPIYGAGGDLLFGANTVIASVSGSYVEPPAPQGLSGNLSCVALNVAGFDSDFFSGVRTFGAFLNRANTASDSPLTWTVNENAKTATVESADGSYQAELTFTYVPGPDPQWPE